VKIVPTRGNAEGNTSLEDERLEAFFPELPSFRPEVQPILPILKSILPILFLSFIFWELRFFGTIFSLFLAQ
jgi:hypothetical protein